jgi:hypothetical protein
MQKSQSAFVQVPQRDEVAGETRSRRPSGFCVVKPDRIGREGVLFLVPAAVVGQCAKPVAEMAAERVVEGNGVRMGDEVDVSDALAVLGPWL